MRKDEKKMKKIKIFVGALLCMNLLTISGCDKVVHSAVVEEKDKTVVKTEEKKRYVDTRQSTVELDTIESRERIEDMVPDNIKMDKKGGKAKNKKGGKNRREKEKNQQPKKEIKAKVITEVEIPETITVGEFASKMGKTSAEVVKKLMMLGVMASQNQAIDFETANGKRTSVCSVGVVIVRNGKIVKKIYRLIRPCPNYYTQWTTAVHGLTYADTEEAEDFPDVWAEIKPLIDGLPLVAHNSPFDEGCLKAVHELYEMTYPNYKFYCTCRTSRKVFGKELPNHQLHTVAARCGYDLTNHHHALADAEACAQIALLIIPEPKKPKVDLHTGSLF